MEAKRPASIICVHRLNGRPMFFQVGRDTVFLSKRPVVVEVKGERVKVRESRKEIEAFIAEA